MELQHLELFKHRLELYVELVRKQLDVLVAVLLVWRTLGRRGVAWESLANCDLFI